MIAPGRREAAKVIARLEAGGARFSRSDGHLACEAPPGLLTEVDRGWLRANRQFVQQYLQDTSPAEPRTAESKSDAIPLTSAQLSIWLASASGMVEHDGFNESMALRIKGPLNLPLAAAAISAVEHAHESTRCRFRVDNGELGQSVSEANRSRPILVDLSGLTQADVDLGRVVAEQIRARPFDLKSDDPQRWSLVQRSDDHLLVSIRHHLVTDGASITPLLSDLAAAYLAGSAGLSTGLGPRIQFTDIARIEAARQSWAIPNDPPVGQQAGVVASLDSDVVAEFRAPLCLEEFRLPGPDRAALDDGFVSRVHTIAREIRATPFEVLLSLVAVSIARRSGQLAVTIGFPTTRRSPGERGVLGCFTAVGELSVRLRTDEIFTSLVHRVGVQLRCSVERAKQDELARSTANVVVMLQDATPSGVDLPGLEVDALDLDPPPKFPLNVVAVDAGSSSRAFVEVAPQNGELSPIAHGIRSDLDAAVRRTDGWNGHSLARLVDEMEGVRSWDRPAADPVKGHADVVNRILACAARSPHSVAVVDSWGVLTYRELVRRAAGLSKVLRGQNIQIGDFVAIDLDRGALAVIAEFAVLMTGAAFVPLDTEAPFERNRHLVGSAGAVGVITMDRARWVDEGLPLFEPSAEPCDAAPVGVVTTAPAYVIYTSGTTGRPNGVVVGRGNLSALVGQADAIYNRDGRAASCHSIAFDFSVWEIWAALGAGCPVYLPSAAIVRDGDRLANELVERAISVWNATPTLFGHLTSQAPRIGRQGCLERVILGGEPIDPEVVRAWRTSTAQRAVRIENWFGITETTVHVTRNELDGIELDIEDGSTSIGRPLDGWSLHVEDPFGVPLPSGQWGELLVGGEGVASGGYLRAPRLTAERFVPDRLRVGGRHYRSGDRGAEVEGQYWHGGRLDQQLSIRGYRIEPAEIVAALQAIDGVERAVVGIDDRAGPTVLATWFIPSSPEVQVEPIRAELAKRLPAYLVPQAWLPVDELPMNLNGKLDREALPVARRGAGVEGRTASSATERLLVRLWADLIDGDEPPVDQNIFVLGADSLFLARLTSQLPASFGVDIELGDVMSTHDLAELATRIDDHFLAELPADVDLEDLLNLVEGEPDDEARRL